MSFKRVDFHSNIVECVEGQLMRFGVAYKIASELLGSRPMPFRDTPREHLRARGSRGQYSTTMQRLRTISCACDCLSCVTADGDDSQQRFAVIRVMGVMRFMTAQHRASSKRLVATRPQAAGKKAHASSGQDCDCHGVPLCSYSTSGKARHLVEEM